MERQAQVYGLKLRVSQGQDKILRVENGNQILRDEIGGLKERLNILEVENVRLLNEIQNMKILKVSPSTNFSTLCGGDEQQLYERVEEESQKGCDVEISSSLKFDLDGICENYENMGVNKVMKIWEINESYLQEQMEMVGVENGGVLGVVGNQGVH